MTLFDFKPAFSDRTPPTREERSKENIFLDHYSWLVHCALNITHGQRERAEDLVHDVFLQFLDKELPLASIGDVRGYLNGILRHLHLLQLRRMTRHPVHSLSLFDHDTALVGMRASGWIDQLQSVDLLVRVCDFSCYRKETALTASVLILRFFHGYYPSEIALLLRAKRRAVDQWIQRGRNEIRQYIDSPYPFPEENGRGREMPSVTSPNAFLRLLRERVFDSCTTACSVLAGSFGELGAMELAHLVSCRSCLDERSRKAGLYDVANRMTDDISDRDDGRPQGGSGGRDETQQIPSSRQSSRRALVRRLHARRQDRFEHYPKEISLAFDGQVHATMLVNAPSNTLSLSLGAKEVPDSIAVLSEQDFHFLVLTREELNCPERKEYRLPFSEDRLLQVSVTPETLGPSIELVYEDRFFSAADPASEWGVESRITGGEEPSPFLPSGISRVTRTAHSGWRDRLGNLFSFMNPMLTSAIVLGAVAVVCFVLWFRGMSTPSAGELLGHAQMSERTAAESRHPGVIYQRIAIRTAQRAVERTIYRDAQGMRRPRHQQLTPQDEQLKTMLASAGVNWDEPLSAVDFAAWRNHMGAVQDRVARPAPHLLTLTTTPNDTSGVIKETLTVRDTDFHAVDRTIDLRDRGTVEIAELNYDVMPWGAVNQDWFEPLKGSVGDAPHIQPALHLPHLPSAFELDEAELAARVALNQLQADTDEPIHVVRTLAGIEVKGIVDTDARKHELLSRLSQLPVVHCSILSVEEIGDTARHPIRLDQPSRVYSVEAQSSPLEQYLREKKIPRDRLEAITQSLLDHSLRIRQAETHLSELRQRFPGTSQLATEQDAQLKGLSQNYRNSIQNNLDATDQVLRSAGFDMEPTSRPLDHGLVDDDLDHLVRQYEELCQEMSTSGTGESLSAEAIVEKLKTLGSLIRQALPVP